ncbi:hypothetical protein SGGMMB4_03031 [Sodalis glossinidius str. 'morsitans']|uniref:Uncharacterized protein n=1 Tax=Sodalis glossinidius (strain morsitans) TaxID=343509 RepID=A0A193QJL3_SODGM|nr:hypothetical protein [Sodalis glossinidius]CRL45367.1 hypothetical protein SGGMMB4_03031 [Sodalis glossinidius str. 'morsitans']
MLTQSLKLHSQTWDLTLDGAGHLATVSEAVAVAQDVVSACKTFLGEVWFNDKLGIPWMSEILGKPTTTTFIQAQLEQQAMRLPYVAQARATVIAHRDKRGASGVIAVIDTNGESSQVSL